MNKLERRIAILERKLKREAENRRHLEDQKEQTSALLTKAINEARESKEEIKRLSLQTAHDLKGPIGALSQMLNDSINALPLKKQNASLAALARVQEIINELLKHYKDESNGNNINETKSKANIIAVIDKIIQEKESAYSDMAFDKGYLASESIFANIREYELSCVLCNILENSIDAIHATDRKGCISIQVKNSKDCCIIRVEDNGIGIKAGDLPKVGQYRMTLKENGNGFGLYNSIQTLENRGGSFKIESERDKGTVVEIKLLKESKDKSFLKVEPDEALILVDDDFLIHEALDSIIPQLQQNREVLHFYSENEFRRWFKIYGSEYSKKSKFIIDGYIASKEPNGPNLIKDLKIKDNAILYTGHEALIKTDAKGLNVFSKRQPLNEIVEFSS